MVVGDEFFLMVMVFGYGRVMVGEVNYRINGFEFGLKVFFVVLLDC